MRQLMPQTVRYVIERNRCRSLQATFKTACFNRSHIPPAYKRRVINEFTTAGSCNSLALPNAPKSLIAAGSTLTGRENCGAEPLTADTAQNTASYVEQPFLAFHHAFDHRAPLCCSPRSRESTPDSSSNNLPKSQIRSDSRLM